MARNATASARGRLRAITCGALATLLVAGCRGPSPLPSPGGAAGPGEHGGAGLDDRGGGARGGSNSRPGPFPSWEERLLHEWTNRARVDPRADLAECRECPDRDCYAPAPPLEWSLPLNRSARFHADEMQRQGFFTHDSRCRIASDIDARYPQACDGSRSCACQGRGTVRFSERLKLFGVVRPSGEVQAERRSDPDSTFYYLLHEPTSSPHCVGGAENGHRWNLLKQTGTVGFGVSGSYTVGDFSRARGPGGPVPSGAHYPRQADTVEFWANWYAAAGPSAALVDVDGTCWPLKLERGGPANGAFSVSVGGLSRGCHRYFFLFRDASGADVTFPAKGSFGLGPEATCRDWDESRPAVGPSCS